MKKVLILYRSVGLGHKYIALNIGFHLQADGYEVKFADVLQAQEGWLVDFGTWLHSFINRRLPFIWRWLYFSRLVNFLGLPLRVSLAKSNSKNIEAIIKEFEPDLIIATQTTASAAVSSLILQKKYHGKFVIAFSDYHLHRFWLYGQADLYLVNIEEQKQAMVELGISAEQIVVCGITLQPIITANKIKVKQWLNIPEENEVILFGSGSLGIGFSVSLLTTYLQELNRQSKLSIIVLCGKNETLKNYLDSLKLQNIRALSFTDRVSEIYQITDLFVTKPGGLTIAEALQVDLKILVTHTLPGQEEPNYKYLLDNALIFPAPKPLNLANLLKSTYKILEEPDQIKDNQSRLAITQKNQEGLLLKKAIKNLFHNV